MKVTTECDRTECFACVDGECAILTDVRKRGEGCSFFKTKQDKPFLARRYEQEREK